MTRNFKQKAGLGFIIRNGFYFRLDYFFFNFRKTILIEKKSKRFIAKTEKHLFYVQTSTLESDYVLIML